ncbi:hypothetical protein [Streptomyces poriticola]|uniref:hypothetical protein n=1 Tax=Streptomyces poriticola TaxID=3120506 RepID=UPI002FCDE5FF
MHRTTTTATLLVTVAVSALSGCVTVQRPPTPEPAPVQTRPSAPRPDDAAEPRLVRAPAREALEMIDPGPGPDPEEAGRTSSSSSPSASVTPRRTPGAAPPEDRKPPPRSGRPGTPAPSAARRPPRPVLPSVPDVPAFPDPAGRGTGGNGKVDSGAVCALGKQYGRWHPDSPEARICEQTYGK